MPTEIRTQDPAPALLLLSIHPQHSERIFRGAKLYELRKSVPRKPIQRVYLYETGTGAIAGCFDVDDVITESPDRLWAIVGEKGTTRERFFSYFAHVQRANAIKVAAPIRFDEPLRVAAIREVVPSFRPPLGFLVIGRDSPLFAALERKRAEEIRNQKMGTIVLEPIRDDHRATFIETATRLVAENYDEITPEFARHLLRVHDLRLDENGFLTVSKEVFSALDQHGRLIGFTVLTEKRGGSAKTGPTFLLPQFLRKGLGRPLRSAIEGLARSKRVRKLYCTCSSASSAMLGHLLRTGYRIEAHLQRQYSVRNSELVFGKILEARPIRPRPTEARAIPARLADQDEFERGTLVQGVQKLFSDRFARVPRRFIERLLAARATPQSPPEKKPRHLLFLKSGKACVGVAVTVPKRGGSTKCSLLLGTSHPATLGAFIVAVERHCRSMKTRKIFVVHPADDSTVIARLRAAHFEVEGILREPYRPGVDEFILSRFIL